MEWWLLWLAGPLAGLVLVLAWRPSRLRQAFGIGFLVLMPVTALTFVIWTNNGCYEGYADSFECDVTSAWWLLALLLLIGILVTAGWGVYRLVKGESGTH